MHERTASPLTSTVHAPHCPSPHPNLGLARPRLSRRTYSSGESSSTSVRCKRLFTSSDTTLMTVPHTCPGACPSWTDLITAARLVKLAHGRKRHPNPRVPPAIEAHQDSGRPTGIATKAQRLREALSGFSLCRCLCGYPLSHSPVRNIARARIHEIHAMAI